MIACTSRFPLRAALWLALMSAAACTEQVPTTPAAPTVNPPAITTAPQSQTVVVDTSATLSVTASGSEPLSYQWYVGTTPTTVEPVPGATAGTFTTPALTSTTSYWVRVSNAAGRADSGTAVVTVTTQPVVATPPTVTAQPQSQSITSGASATLSVAATGTAPLSYQWYVGSAPTTTNPVAGATASVFSTPALRSTTSYWVRVSNPAGEADSNTAVVAVTTQSSSATPPAVAAQPQSQSITSGATATLSVAATGSAPLSYQWYVGAAPTITTPVAGATASTFTTPALTSTTSYWVRVSNPAGQANSGTAVVTVTPQPATPPAVTAQPQNQSIASGATATLSVTATGTTPLSYQWYVGAAPTTTNPVAGATASSFTTPALTSTTSYWVRVSNPAGQADSSTATVTVAPSVIPVRLHVYADDYGTLSVDGNLLGSYNNPAAGGIIDATINLTRACHTISMIYRNQAGTNALSLSWLLPGDPDLSIVPVSALRSLNASGAQTNGLRGDYFTLGGAAQFTRYGEGPIEHGALSFTQENYQGVSGLWAGVYGPSSQFEERVSGQICIP